MQWLKALIISLAAAAALPAAAAPPQALAVPALFAELDRRAGANNKVIRPARRPPGGSNSNGSLCSGSIPAPTFAWQTRCG